MFLNVDIVDCQVNLVLPAKSVFQNLQANRLVNEFSRQELKTTPAVHGVLYHFYLAVCSLNESVA